MSDFSMAMNIRISLPEDVKYIIRTINEAGYEAYAVGGCVRDKLLNKEPNDYDITTSAKPLDIKKLFRRTIDTGIEHGTVTVMLKDKGYEITTYRIDGAYEDNRHPSTVSFTDDLTEDLLRRDFTINAMAYNDEKGLVDPFNGCQDLSDHVIRCVGIAYERFSEDALRIMRAVRFSAQLGYRIDDETYDAMCKLSPNLKDVSMERIQVELVKLVTSSNPQNIRIAYKTGITKVFFDEFDKMMETSQNHPHHMYSVGEHSIKAMENIEDDKYLRLAMLFHDIGKPLVKVTDEEGIDHFHGHAGVSKQIATAVLKRLKFDNNTIKIVSKLSYYHDLNINTDQKSVRRAINEVGEDIFPLLLKVKKADILAQSEYKREEKLSKLNKLNEIYNAIIANGDCLNLKDLAINGSDLIDIGYPMGSALGKELNRLLQNVLEDPSLNEKDQLLKMSMEDLGEIK